jgi:hypothetical protein
MPKQQSAGGRTGGVPPAPRGNPLRDLAEAGGLMSNGTSIADAYRRIASE